jgi:hypothetical protein
MPPIRLEVLPASTCREPSGRFAYAVRVVRRKRGFGMPIGWVWPLYYSRGRFPGSDLINEDHELAVVVLNTHSGE